MRRVLFIALVGCVSMLNAQTLQKTALTIEKFKGAAGMRVNPADIRGFGSDESNYYVYYGITGLWGGFDASFFVIDKNLTSAKEFSLSKDKDDRFLWVQTTEDDMVILLARDKKGEEKTQIIKQAYAKTTGKLKKETVIANFPKSKSDNWYFYSSTSPDKTKKCFLFLLANKKNSVDSYYAAVLNQDCEMEWNTTQGLEVSNESFSVGDIAVNNKGDVYVAFLSGPKDEKKPSDPNSYIDLIYLTDGSKDKMSFGIDKKHIRKQIQLKALKNNDIYLAGLLSEESVIKKEFLSIKINGNNFNVLGEHRERLEGKGNIKDQTVSDMVIVTIFELNNGDVAVLGEQRRTNITDQGIIKMCWGVTTFFVKGDDASIEHVSARDKSQLVKTSINYSSYQLFHLSIFPFVYENKIGYLFNDCLKRYANPSKYKREHFKSANGDDVSIVLSTQESGEKAEIVPLTGNKLPAKRLIRQILFQEDDQLIVLTRNRKEAYIETLNLK